MTESKRQPGTQGSGAWSDVGRYYGYGLSWALSTLLFFLLGFWLDTKLGTVPWLSILGAFAGGGAGFYTLYMRVVVEPRQRDKDEP